MTPRPLTVGSDGRPDFFRTRHGRVVHVFDHRGIPSMYVEIDSDIADTPVGGILLERPYARCGAEGIAFSVDEGFIDVFSDADLCVACHRSVAEEEAHRLFEHPQAEEGP